MVNTGGAHVADDRGLEEETPPKVREVHRSDAALCVYQAGHDRENKAFEGHFAGNGLGCEAVQDSQTGQGGSVGGGQSR